MKFKKSFFLLCFIVILFVMASAYAGEVNQTLISSDEADQIGIDESFDIKKDELKSSEEIGDTHVLDAGEDDGYVHIYVNASSAFDGNGSRESPYQKLSSVNNMIVNNTVLHIADGYYNYEFSGKRSMEIRADVKFIGESSENTCIDFDGGMILGHCEYSPKINLENIRLYRTSVDLISRDANISYGSKIEAINVTFENSKSRLGYAENTIGGAIICFGELRIIDCIFKNNSAGYGGAVYACGGEISGCSFIDNVAEDRGGALFFKDNEMRISDSSFLNNIALTGGAIYASASLSIDNSNFTDNSASYNGGAIASVESKNLYLMGVRFINDSAEYSAGAVYSLLTVNYFLNSSFVNCSSKIGGAVCDLNSFSQFTGVNFTSNNAVKGGALYKMYNSTSISNSTFVLNQAHEGGAIYIDEADWTVLSNLHLDDNSADNGSDIFYMGDIDKLNMSDVVSPNISSINFFNPIHEAGNYSIFEINDTSVVIESRYDMREYGFLTEVKDQKNEGNCWAFAAIAALESCILKANGTAYDLSEQNLKNLMAMFSDYGDRTSGTNSGGNPFMSIGYFASWLGPVYDVEDPYSSNALSLLYDALTHIQNVLFIKRTSYTDNDNLKEAIMKYGPVVADIYYSDEYLKDVSYYVPNLNKNTNHAITIVGWDDNYPKDKFKNTPPGDGAFIVRNSWGQDWGENGYFYISYYDTSLLKFDYPRLYTFVLNDTNRYEKNYQHEFQITNWGVLNANPIYIGNSFMGEDDELLSAVSTYFGDESEYNIQIYVNGDLRHSQEGNVSAGYFTIPLTKSIPIKREDIFDIIFEITSLNSPNPALYYSGYVRNPRINQTGVSFYSIDGEIWYDAGKRYNIVIPIKGFTRYGKLNATLEVTGLDNNWTINMNYSVVAKVTDFYGDYVDEGNVTFMIDGVEYAVELSDGYANMTVLFKQAGNHSISVFYNNTYYYYPTDVVFSSFTIDPVATELSLRLENSTVFSNDTFTAVVRVNATQGKANIYINGILNRTVEVNEDGVAVFILNGLSHGRYNMSADFFDELGTYLNSSNKTSFDVFIRTYPQLNGLEWNWTVNRNHDITVKVIDQYGEYVNVGNVTFMIDGVGYTVDLMDNASIKTVLFNQTGKHDLQVFFNGFGYYYPSASEVISLTVSRIKTQLSGSEVSAVYNIAKEFQVTLSDVDGNPIAGVNVTVDLNGIKTFVSDANGQIRLSTYGLNPKMHMAKITFKGNEIYMDSSLNLKVTVIKANAKIIAKNKAYKAKSKTKKFKITLKDNVSKPIKKAKVTLKIKSKTYKAKTNDKGKATFKITGLTKKGKYKPTVKFMGNEYYNSATKKVKITVRSA